MAWEQIFGQKIEGKAVVLYPGAWDPPTIAHLAIARAARKTVGHVVWVLPRIFPHKPSDPAGVSQRSAMLSAIAAAEEGFSVALTDAGLFREIADEARACFGPETEISLVCGRDAAERIATWNYGVPDAFEDLIARYRLLVAARTGEYDPAQHVRLELARRIASLPLESSFDAVSSSEVRRRIAAREPWEDLVPEPVVKMVRDLYSSIR
jgi:nicotinate-nucleotide adenylyltransferase